MRAAVYHGARDIRIDEVPRPRPAAGEVLVRVHANGICGTDASEFSARGCTRCTRAMRSPATSGR